ncbi:heterokaryon incompatibility protein-domain-containing protein [Phaeosphaeria sp. MPI-PUGE-AT-0046c]|nr:heterokaryon incompatibility protein-domain-containing protein [Phaeosphaeria sp. MPI-PUGE-AT-0046c]
MIQRIGKDSCQLCSIIREAATEYELGETNLRIEVAVEDGPSSLGKQLAKNVQINYQASSGVILRVGKVTHAAMPYGYIALYQPRKDSPANLYTLSNRKLDPGKIHWTIIHHWLQTCNDNHGCMLSTVPGDFLPGFKVIDIRTRKIVNAPKSCKYVALSYVWGTTRENGVADDLSLPDPVPLTIEDAIKCVQALDLWYLWVDRYCIDQNASETKHLMIQGMDRIYSDATLTIIDAEGTDSSAGLAGVSQVSRKAPRWVNVQGQCLSIVPNVVRTVRSNHWNTRGWTYQEGLLSNRRLLFTNSQVYFQCLRMHCCESLAANFRCGSRSRIEIAETFQVFPSGRDTVQAKTFKRRLDEYLHRNLTYDSDILNAFSGILRQFWYAHNPIYHFWGLHIVVGKFLAALFWLPVGDGPKKDLSRREGFSSWTWAGWRDITEIYVPSFWPMDSEHVSISIEDVAGNRYDPASYIKSMSDSWDIYRFKPAISLTSWVLNVRLAPVIAPSLEHTTNVNLLGAGSDVVLAKALFLTPYIRESSPSSTNTWPLFFWVGKDGDMKGFVLKHVADQRHERAGVVRWAFVDSFTVVDEENARIRQDYWEPGVWLQCRRQSIELV